MTDYSKLTKDEIAKKLDEANEKIEKLQLEDVKAKATKKDKEDVTKLPLAQKIARSMEDMGAIAKDGTNQKQDWQFISEAAIKGAVRKVAAKYGFAIIPTKVLKTNVYNRQTKSGGVLYFYDVIQEFTIMDGKEQIEGQMIGTGSDSGDKAVNKAVTVAFKNFEKQLFNVSDQNDEDPDALTPEETVPNSRTVKPKPKTKSVKKTINWSKPETIPNNVLENYTVKYTNGEPVLLTTIINHVHSNNAKAKAFADTLKGRDSTAYVELDKRIIASKASQEAANGNKKNV